MIGKRTLLILTCLALAVSPVAWLYARNGLYGINVILHRGGSIWPVVASDDPRLTQAAQLALKGATGVPGPLRWTTLRPGFEVGELPVIVNTEAVDQVYLARIDPKFWRFSVHNASAGDHDLDRWMTELKATLVVNGSYYDQKGWPDTPFLSGGALLGPENYRSSHGAFVASASGAQVVDLRGKDWREAFSGMDAAMVSYPLLLDKDGESRAVPSRWLAGRSFVGQDRQDRIIIGTTKDAFFSLDRFADFLRRSPLDLATALNLDGGPVACQGVDLDFYKRRTCGPLEIQVEEGRIRLLQPLLPGGGWALPVVLAVSPK